MSYLSGIYLKSCLFWLGVRPQKTLKNEKNRQKKNIKKGKERKTKNTGKVQLNYRKQQ